MSGSLYEYLFVEQSLTTKLATFAHKLPHSKISARSVEWHLVNFDQVKHNIDAVASFLLQLGFRPGDRFAYLARSEYKTMLIDFACLRAGIVAVPIYETSSSKQIEYILEATNAKTIFTPSARYLKNIPDGVKIISNADLNDAISSGHIAEELDRFSPNADDLAVIMFTAGFDGNRVEVKYTNSDFIRNVSAVSNVIRNSGVDTSRMLNFLSLAHIAPRIFLYASIKLGAYIGLSPGVRELLPDLQYVKPTFLVSVPRVYDRLYAEIVDASPRSILGIRYKKSIRRAFSAPVSDDFHQKMLKLLGGNLSVTFSTAVKPDPKLLEFYANIGVGSYDCYGLTEAKGLVSMNLPGANKFGTAGKVIPGHNVEIEDGKIIVDGLNTGDLGEIDNEGYLTILGRDKETIITRSGRNVLPESIQQALATDPLIDDVLVIGERRPYISALIALNPVHKAIVLENCGLEEATIEAEVVLDKLVQKAVDTVNRALSPEERIIRYAILVEGFEKSDDFVTGSLKLRRDKVCKHYKNLINEVLYG